MKRRDFLVSSAGVLVAMRAGAQAKQPCTVPLVTPTGGTAASTSCAAAPTQVPAWINTAVANGWAPNTWATIGGGGPSHGLSATNTVANVAPSNAQSLGSPAAVMDAWNGGAFASQAGTYGKFIVHGGGHADYQGNEVYGFDVGTRMWSRLSDPYPNPVWPNASAWWPAHGAQVNGSPGVRHTYDLVEYHPQRNSFWSFGAQTSDNANGIPLFCEFSLNTNTWTRRGLSAAGFGGAGWSCYDSRRDRFICHGDGGGSSSTIIYSPSTDTFAYTDQSNSAGLGVTDNTAAYDPVNDFIFVLRRDSGSMYGLNAASLSQDVVTLNAVNKPSTGGGAGLEYCPELNGFIYYRSGTSVYLITKGAGTWNTASWTWRDLTSGGNSITPENPNINNIYSRFRVARHGNYVVAYTVKRTGHTGSGAMYAFMLSNAAS
jgi:hypothetical protein